MSTLYLLVVWRISPSWYVVNLKYTKSKSKDYFLIWQLKPYGYLYLDYLTLTSIILFTPIMYMQGRIYARPWYM